MPPQPDWQPTSYTPHPYFTYHYADYIIDTLQRQRSAHWSFLGETDSAAVAYAEEGGTPRIPLPADAYLRPARSEIARLAAETPVTFINEAHHLPHHRTFTAGLLDTLYALGYRHLGLETLAPYPIFDSIVNSPEPQITVGFFGREPEMANLIRRARRVGFRIFSYDEGSNSGGTPLREIGGARRIADYARRHPGEKLLIHCGYAHAREGNYAPWEKALAQRVGELLNVDPLTVSQTSLEETRTGEVMVIAPPYVLRGDSSSYFDLYVAHPADHSVGSRPDYKFTLGRLPLTVRIEAARVGEGPFLLFAFPAGADHDLAMPFDLVAVRGGETAVLAVPEGAAVDLLLRGRNGSFLADGARVQSE